MSNLEKAIEHLDEQVRTYRQNAQDDGNGYCEVLKQITATLYYIESHRAAYHDKYQSIVDMLVLEGKSVSRAENMAHVAVPEIYKLRRIMDAAYEVVGAIRTQISWIKTGITNV